MPHEIPRPRGTSLRIVALLTTLATAVACSHASPRSGPLPRTASAPATRPGASGDVATAGAAPVTEADILQQRVAPRWLADGRRLYFRRQLAESSSVPKDFGIGEHTRTIADRGFIVVQIDGMGTSQRSKAFHDVAWKNLRDAGFPDRIAWIRAAAARHPEMDLARVGIFGGSAGGQNAMRALLSHGDFYQVAVADSGCHDNRMDKIWWNEQWMGWPVDASYARSSNVVDAGALRGKLLLIVGELDRNVDPSSTLQVVNALIKADKDFDLLVVPGAGHGAAETRYGSRRRLDFFVKHLLPPDAAR